MPGLAPTGQGLHFRRQQGRGHENHPEQRSRSAGNPSYQAGRLPQPARPCWGRRRSWLTSWPPPGGRDTRRPRSGAAARPSLPPSSSRCPARLQGEARSLPAGLRRFRGDGAPSRFLTADPAGPGLSRPGAACSGPREALRLTAASLPARPLLSAAAAFSFSRKSP